jgi:hypothetical protein
MVETSSAKQNNETLNVHPAAQENSGRSDEDFVKISNWEEIMAKIAEIDVAVESFLKNCVCLYSPKRNKYFIISSNQLMASMLGTDKNKKCIFDAMVCCDVDISMLSQIEVIFRKNKVEKNDLDEF